MRSVALRSGLLLLALTFPLHAATISGELIDTYCYAHHSIRGLPHAACAVKCARAGIPVGLLEDGTHRIIVLLPEKDLSPLPPALINQMGHNVVIEGEPVVKGGATFFVVRSFRVTR